MIIVNLDDKRGLSSRSFIIQVLSKGMRYDVHDSIWYTRQGVMSFLVPCDFQSKHLCVKCFLLSPKQQPSNTLSFQWFLLVSSATSLRNVVLIFASCGHLSYLHHAFDVLVMACMISLGLRCNTSCKSWFTKHGDLGDTMVPDISLVFVGNDVSLHLTTYLPS